MVQDQGVGAAGAVGVTAPAPRPVVAMRAVRKSYGSNDVLRDITVHIHAGQVLALAGENGAGKSTLMKILAGLVVPDHGSVTVDGAELAHGSVLAARRAGIAIVPQELAPVPDMTVAQNIFLGREPRTRYGTIDSGAMVRRTREMLDRFGVDIDPRAVMRHLSTAAQQLVEIVKSASTGARVLLLDEPTSAISQQEVERLYAVVEDLRAQGVAMVYTTHKMAEIRALADRVVILRDGVLITDEATSDITDEQIVTAMIGRELEDLFPGAEPADADGPVVLEVEDLVVHPGGPAVSLQVRAGEVVALAGLIGAGRTELLETIFGVRPAVSGQVRVHGRPVPRADTTAAIRAGLALVPEDRKVGGAVLSMSILRNAVLPRLPAFTRAGWLQRRAATQAVRAVVEDVRLRHASLSQEVGHLSGGNQQKVVIARWLIGDAPVLLLDEPTRGVDVGARSEIYRLIADLVAEHQVGVLMASSDMPEVIGLAHRILVMRGGEVVDGLDRADHPDPAQLQELVFRRAAGIDSPSLQGGTP